MGWLFQKGEDFDHFNSEGGCHPPSSPLNSTTGGSVKMPKVTSTSSGGHRQGSATEGENGMRQK